MLPSHPGSVAVADGMFDIDYLASGSGTTTGGGVLGEPIQIPSGYVPVWVHLQGLQGALHYNYNDVRVYSGVAHTLNLVVPVVGRAFQAPGGLFGFIGTGLSAGTGYTITIGCKAVDPRFTPDCP